MDQPEQFEQQDRGLSFVQILVIILVALVVLFFGIVGPVLLVFWGADDDASWLERVRDISIYYMGFLWVVIFLLVGIVAAVMVWVAFAIKNRLLPVLEDIVVNIRETSGEVTQTAHRARGTAEFVSERIATPIISTLGTAAKWRATARMFVRGNRKR